MGNVTFDAALASRFMSDQEVALIKGQAEAARADQAQREEEEAQPAVFGAEGGENPPEGEVGDGLREEAAEPGEEELRLHVGEAAGHGEDEDERGEGDEREADEREFVHLGVLWFWVEVRGERSEVRGER